MRGFGYFAARALGAHGDGAALDPLGRLAAADSAPYARIASLEAIGAIDGARAADLLLSHAEDADPAIAAAALTALGRVTDARVMPTLTRALRSVDAQRRHAAVLALSRRGGNDAVASLRWTAETESDPEVSRAALDGLTRLGGMASPGWEGAIDALVDLTADAGRRSAALDALSRVPAARVDRISHGLAHPLRTVRRSIIEALTRMKHPDASLRVREALDHADAVVREAAIIALDRIGARGVARKLSTLAATDPVDAVRRAAGVALSRHTDPNGEGGAGG